MPGLAAFGDFCLEGDADDDKEDKEEAAEEEEDATLERSGLLFDDNDGDLLWWPNLVGERPNTASSRAVGCSACVGGSAVAAGAFPANKAFENEKLEAASSAGEETLTGCAG